MKHIVLSGGRLVITEFLDDTVKHKIITEYEFRPDGTAEAVSERTDYCYGIPAPVRDEKLVPFCFFEALKAGAYREAARYLASGLRENVPAGDEKNFFHGFFGEFSAVYPDRSGATALVYKKENGYETKLFIAELDNDGLITNFS